MLGADEPTIAATRDAVLGRPPVGRAGRCEVLVNEVLPVPPRPVLPDGRAGEVEDGVAAFLRYTE